MGKTKKHASVTQKKKNNERLKNNELIVAEDEMQTYAMVPMSMQRWKNQTMQNTW